MFFIPLDEQTKMDILSRVFKAWANDPIGNIFFPPFIRRIIESGLVNVENTKLYLRSFQSNFREKKTRLALETWFKVNKVVFEQMELYSLEEIYTKIYLMIFVMIQEKKILGIGIYKHVLDLELLGHKVAFEKSKKGSLQDFHLNKEIMINKLFLPIIELLLKEEDSGLALLQILGDLHAIKPLTELSSLSSLFETSLCKSLDWIEQNRPRLSPAEKGFFQELLLKHKQIKFSHHFARRVYLKLFQIMDKSGVPFYKQTNISQLFISQFANKKLSQSLEFYRAKSYFILYFSNRKIQYLSKGIEAYFRLKKINKALQTQLLFCFAKGVNSLSKREIAYLTGYLLHTKCKEDSLFRRYLFKLQYMKEKLSSTEYIYPQLEENQDLYFCLRLSNVVSLSFTHLMLIKEYVGPISS